MARAATRFPMRALLASRHVGMTQTPVALLRPLAPISRRTFASAASGKVAKVLGGELKHEEEQYQQAKDLKSFLQKTPFKFVDADGDVNMVLEREMGDKLVKIEWQLTSPFDPDAEMEGEGGEQETQATDLSITVESKAKGNGLIFYCSTQSEEGHRYVIGSVRAYGSHQERDLESGYNGPEFEDLDDKLQEAFDEYLAEVGMSSEVCDFIDAMALDKEQREYVRWLKSAKAFLEE